MSKGSPIKLTRVPKDVEAEVYRTIARRNVWSRRPPWTWSSFVVDAIREKLSKMERSRRNGGKRKKRDRASTDTSPSDTVQ